MDMTAADDLKPYRLLLATVGIAVFMSSLDVTIVNISLPTISHAFSVNTTTVSWVVMAYLLMMCSFLPAFGRLGDIRGYRLVFTTGYAVFVAGSFLCGISSGIWMLIGSRIFQGIGASMLAALCSAIIMVSIPPASRGRALGFVAMFASLGIALGPAIGGFLTTYLSWHWIFFINVPVGITGFFIALRTIPGVNPVSQEQRFDPFGAFLIFFVLLFVLYVLNQGHAIGWTSPVTAGLVGVAIVCLTAFIWWERKIPYRLFNLGLFRNRDFLCPNIGALIVMLVFSGALFLFPFYFEMVRGLSTEMTGLVLTIPSAAIFVAGPLMGAVTDRIGSRIPCLICALLLGAGFFLFTRLGNAGGGAVILTGLVLMGFGVGGFIPSSSVQIMRQAKCDESGAVSSMMMTIRNMGSVMGVALFEMIFAYGVIQHLPYGSVTSIKDVPVAALVSGFSFAFMAGAVTCVVAVVMVLVAREGSCEGNRREGGGFL
jgi:EmrB/QacA subfamily drug resistance transporter